MTDPIKLLERDDKWFLSDGKALIFAPKFPLFLNTFGFFDPVHYLDHEYNPCWTITILDENDNEVKFVKVQSSWKPSCLTQIFASDEDYWNLVEVKVTKYLTPESSLISELNLNNKTGKRLKFSLILWILIDLAKVNSVSLADDYSRIIIELPDENEGKKVVPFYLSIGSNIKPGSFAALLADRMKVKLPDWSLTPLSEKIVNGKFSNENQIKNSDRAFCFVGFQYPIEISSESEKFFGIMSTGATKEQLNESFNKARQEDPYESVERYWRKFFGSIPQFSCSDPFIERYYWYRWFGLLLNKVEPGPFNHKFPCIYEGIEYFRGHISYSTQCHVLESRWMNNPTLAQGCILGLFEHMRVDGFLPGRINAGKILEGTFYHADWGRVILALHEIHPDIQFLEKVYPLLVRYLRYFEEKRDTGKTALYDVIDHWETGQEFNRRYQEVHPEADKGEKFIMKGVDATVYIYNLQKALTKLALILRKVKEAEEFEKKAEKTGKAILEKMWASEQKIFFDLDGKSLKPTGVKTPNAFYVFLTDLPKRKHTEAITKHLFNKDEFWSKWPIPSVSIDDSDFNAEAEWRGRRKNCPWTGRVWPMINSHICDALGISSEHFQGAFRTELAELLLKFIKMMFFNQDPRKPNCFEHYNPFTGKPCTYRGIDDYQHSWVVDLIIKYIIGFHVEEGGFSVHPLDLGLDYFTIQNIPLKGHKVSIIWRSSQIDEYSLGLSVFVDGNLIKHSDKLERITTIYEL